MTIPVGYTDDALVSVPQLQRFMSNVNFNQSQKDEAASVLKEVQNDLEVYCNRPLQPLHVREARQTDSQGYLNLSASPIQKIILITPVENVFEPALYATPPVLSPMQPQPGVNRVSLDYVATNFGDPLIVPGGVYIGGFTTNPWLGYGNGFYIAEYIGGWIGYYEDSVKLGIKKVAARIMMNNHDDFQSLQADNATNATPRDSRPPEWTDGELRKFDRMRRRVIAR